MPATPSALSWPWLQKNFAATSWTLVRRSTLPDEHEAKQASEVICRVYWHPLYVFLRNRGYSQGDAQDHVQSFLAKLIHGGMLRKADPERGRLRTYLMTLVQRHAASRHAASVALKRGGGVAHVTTDFIEAESSYHASCLLESEPEISFRRRLAVRLVEETIEVLEAEFTKAGRRPLFEALLPSLEGVMPDCTFADLAVELEMTPSALRVASFRLRERFRKGLRKVASHALGIPVGPALDEEMRLIFG